MPKLFHSFVSSKSDSADASLVRPSNWNDSIQYGNSAGTAPTGTPAIVREALTGNRTYYFRTDGSSLNSGLVDSSSGAFSCIQDAWNVMCATLDFNGYDVTIEHGNEGAGVKTFSSAKGRFETGVYWTGAGNVTIQGNATDLTTPSNCVLEDTLATSYGAITFLGTGGNGLITIAGGFKLTSVAGDCINVWGLLLVQIGYLEYGVAGGYHLYPSNGTLGIGINTAGSSYIISGGAYAHYYAGELGYLQPAGSYVTILNTPAFTSAFAVGESLSFILSGGISFKNYEGKTRQDATGSINLGSATISNLNIGTSLVSTGMAVVGTGIPTGATVSTIPTSNSVTISTNATATSTTVNVAFEIATGSRYIVNNNAFITTYGSGPLYFPGTTAGTSSNGGIYG